MSIVQVELPHVGESVTQAIIGKWIASPGDAVRKYDPLVEVVTDKVNMEVPAPADGKLVNTLVSEGDTVEMGSPIAEMEIEERAGKVDGESDRQEETSSVQSASRIGSMIVGANVGPTGGEFRDTSLEADSQSGRDAADMPPIARRSAREGRNRGDNRYSPIVRRLAERHDIDLSEVQGSGRNGRVTKQDVEAYLASTSTAAGTQDELIDPSPVRRMVAENMVRSVSEIPHAWGAIEVDVTGLVEYRNVRMAQIHTETGRRLTYLPIVLHHVAKALGVHRRINSSWIDSKIVLKGSVNIGVAVATEQGLVVPVLRSADRLTLSDSVSEMARLVDAARSNRLKIEDVEQGTFTLNNTGALGSVWGGAIINYPQAAILTTESIVKRPIVVSMPEGNDAIAIRSMMNMCLSFDHRIIDGAEAMSFLRDVKDRLESIGREENDL